MNKIILFLLLSLIHSMPFAQKNDESKIVHAVLTSNSELVSSLLDSGMNPDTKNDKNKTLLYLATENNDLGMVDLLLRKGALVDFPFGEENENRIMKKNKFKVIDPTPFLYAAAHGQAEILNRLIQEKPDLEIRNFYGGNALIPAAEKGHYETAKLLLEKTNIDVNFVNYLGWTALLEVVLLSKNRSMQLKMAKLLLEHGADINIKDNNGVSALVHVRINNNEELTLLLESYL